MLTNKKELRLFIFLGAILAVLFIVTFIIGNRIERGNVSSPAMVAQNPFDSVSIQAKAAYVYDVRTGQVLYAKNADERLPLASLTKVMTALVATNIAPPYSTIDINKEAIDTEGDSGLELGEKWSLHNLLNFSLTVSSNDGARAVGLALGALNQSGADPTAVENDFIKDMNTEADAIGMKNTYYLNDTGLDQSTQQAGAYGTAKDIATLFQYVLKNHPEIMEDTRDTSVDVASESGVVHAAVNTDPLVSQIPGILASKTGSTDLAGGNLAVAFDPELGRPIIVVVLGSTDDGRYTDTMALVNASLSYIEESTSTNH